MKKIQKTKKGFTLVEMVLVIAIIVILAAVLAFSVRAYLDKAEAAASKLSTHQSNVEAVTAEIDSYLK